MSNHRIAAQSAWAALSETSAAVGSIVGTVNNSVTMLNDFVKRHRDQQVVKTAIETGDYITRLVETKTREIQTRREETAAWLNNDASRIEKHNAILAEVNAWLPEDKRIKLEA
jgi:hypothetical protein